MSGQVLVDTGAFYALQVRGDRWHAHATRALKLAVARRTRLLTTNHVIGECYTLLMKTHGNAAAWRFFDTLGRSGRLEILHVDAKLEAQAWKLLRQYSDQSFSFVDATSFAVMRSRRLKFAFAFDVHFSTAGFTRVPLEAEPW
jgi:predicted nucleic acid-binding protein